MRGEMSCEFFKNDLKDNRDKDIITDLHVSLWNIDSEYWARFQLLKSTWASVFHHGDVIKATDTLLIQQILITLGLFQT